MCLIWFFFFTIRPFEWWLLLHSTLVALHLPPGSRVQSCKYISVWLLCLNCSSCDDIMTFNWSWGLETRLPLYWVVDVESEKNCIILELLQDSFLKINFISSQTFLSVVVYSSKSLQVNDSYDSSQSKSMWNKCKY